MTEPRNKVPQPSRVSRSEGRPYRTLAAFTLMELLVAMGIIVLLVSLAVPVMRLMSGGRGVDAAENQLSAALVQTRTDAVGLQEPRGLFLFRDPNTDQAAAVEVYIPDPENNPNRLEVLPDRDEILLPVGIGMQVLGNDGRLVPRGVIMFDRLGQVMLKHYEVTTGSALGQRIRGSATDQVSQFGFAVYDQEAFAANEAAVTAGAGNPKWVQENGVPFLVNRYNGTLLRVE